MLLMLGGLQAIPSAAQDQATPPGIAVEHHDVGEDGGLDLVRVDGASARIQIVAAGSPWLFPEPSTTRLCETTGTDQSADGREACLRDIYLQGSPQSDPAFLLTEFLGKTGALAVLSGGYLKSFSPPVALGLVVVDGHRFAKNHASWLTTVVLCESDAGAVLVSSEDFDTSQYESCLQSGPMIVESGRSRYDDLDAISAGELNLVRSVQEQAFVCVDGNGQFVLGVSTPLELSVFADFLANQVHCDRAMRLSGHTTAGMAVGERVFGFSDIPLANAIAVIGVPASVPQ